MTEKPKSITVDVLISAVVLDAATARLNLVKRRERETQGKALSNLSTLAEKIILEWEPGQTKRGDPAPEADCPTCGRTVKVYNTGKLRVHKHPDTGVRCPDAFAPEISRKVDTRPLRFPMNRARYEDVKERIHIHGQSVASVITQRLADFARHGTLA